MSIQSSINQTLSLASLLVSQNPEVKAAGEKAAKLRDLSRREKAIALHGEGLTESTMSTIRAGMRREGTEVPEEAMKITAKLDALGEAHAGFRAERTAIAKEKASIDPTRENVEAYVSRRVDELEIAASERKLDEIIESSRVKREAAKAESDAALASRKEEVDKSRAFAKMITEGVSGLSFDPDTYEPPERKK